LIWMSPLIGGVLHDPVNTQYQAEWARTADIRLHCIVSSGAVDGVFFPKIAMVDCWVIHPPALDSDGACHRPGCP
jgi:hypothetical protein